MNNHLSCQVLCTVASVCSSLVNVKVVSVDQLHTLLPVRIRFRIARHIGVEHKVHRISVIVPRPRGLCSIEIARLPPRVGIEIMDKTDPVAIHEP